MKTEEWKMMTTEQKYSLGVYPKRDLEIIRGEGAELEDREGNRYIDCIAGHGVAALGHSHPSVVAAIAKQAQTLITCPGTFYNDVRAGFMEKLVNLSPQGLDRVFLCNSGTEAIEAAIKFARISSGKTGFICAMKGFHGRTMGALSATFNPKYRKEFMPLVPGFSHVPYNNFDKLADAVNEETAGIILEPVQGEGGVHVGDGDYFKKVRQLCDEKSILLIIDEIQTGLGRTGRMFGVEHLGINPDILCLAKALGGGVPMGAVLCTDAIDVPVGKHGSTFGGNPLACAAGSAVLDVMKDENLPAQAKEKGHYLMAELKPLNSPRIREIRGLGLMIGIELKEKVRPIIEGLMKKGVLALPAGSTVLRLLPPLTIRYEQLDEVVKAVADVLS